MATNNYSAQKVVLDLLRYIGVTGFTAVANDQILNQPGLDTDDVTRAIAAVNSGLQTIQKYGPQSMKYGRRSAYYSAPTTLIMSVAQGLGLTVAATTPPAAMKGCTVMIDGDTDINRCMAISGNNLSFLRPYLGATNAAVSATIYYDCASLDADVQAVLEPVHGNNKVRLFEAQDIDRFERLRNRVWAWDWPQGYIGSVDAISTSLGTPALYMVERQRDGTPFLRITPMPPSPFDVTFQAKLRAERITATVLDQTGVSDPGYYFVSLHDDEVESMLLPIARKRFFTHPALKNSESRTAVDEEFKEVMTLLRNGIALKPSVGRSRARYR